MLWRSSEIICAFFRASSGLKVLPKAMFWGYMVAPSCTAPCRDSATVKMGIPNRVFSTMYFWMRYMLLAQLSPVRGKPSTNPHEVLPAQSVSFCISSSCPLKIFEECMCRICAIFSSTVMRFSKSSTRSSMRRFLFLYGRDWAFAISRVDVVVRRDKKAIKILCRIMWYVFKDSVSVKRQPT